MRGEQEIRGTRSGWELDPSCIWQSTIRRRRRSRSWNKHLGEGQRSRIRGQKVGLWRVTEGVKRVDFRLIWKRGRQICCLGMECKEDSRYCISIVGEWVRGWWWWCLGNTKGSFVLLKKKNKMKYYFFYKRSRCNDISCFFIFVSLFFYFWVFSTTQCNIIFTMYNVD